MVSPESLQPKDDSKTPPPSKLHELVHDASSLLLGDTPKGQTSSTRDAIEGFATEAIKMVPLFLPGSAKLIGRFGTYALSGTLWGLDETRSGSGDLSQFALGALKGVAGRGAFDLVGSQAYGGFTAKLQLGAERSSAWLGARNMGTLANGIGSLQGMPIELASKAWGMGITNRMSDSLLTQQNYTDSSGNFSLGTGLQNTFYSTLRPANLATDLAFFSASPLFAKAADGALSIAASKINAIGSRSESALGISFRPLPTTGIIERSPLTSTALTAAGFGYLSGTTAELDRQYQQGQALDFLAASRAGLWQAGTSAVGSIPGGALAGRMRFAGLPAAAGEMVPSPSEKPAARSYPADGIAVASPDVAFAMRAYHAEGVDRRPPFARVSDPYRQTAELLGIPSYRKIGEQTDKSQPLFGAVQYESTLGDKFWQLTDGRILAEHDTDTGTARQLWAPAGSRQQSFLVHDENLAFFDERHGHLTDFETGTPMEGPTFAIANPYGDVLSQRGATEQLERRLDALTMVAPQFEQPWQSDLRLLPARSGQLYDSGLFTLRQTQVESPGPGSDSSYGRMVLGDAKQVQARTYYVLSNDQMKVHAELKDGLLLGQMSDQEYAEASRVRQSVGEPTRRLTQQEYDQAVDHLRDAALKVTVPEEYAQRMEALEHLRSLATLPPELFPDRRDEIFEARRQQFLSPYGNRLTYRTVGQMIPLPHAIRGGILLLDEPANGSEGSVHGSAGNDGVIRVYANHLDIHQQVPALFDHEVSHLVALANPDLATASKLAYQLSGFEGSRRNTGDAGEVFADGFGRMVLNHNPEYFLSLAQQDPLQAVILGRALQREMDRPDSDLGNRDRNVLQRRQDIIDDHVVEQAREQLLGYLQTPTGLGVGLRSEIAGQAPEALGLVRSLAQGETRQLAKDLVDTEALSEQIDLFASAGKQSYDKVASAMIKMEVLRTVDDQWYQSHRDIYDATVQRLRQANDRALTDSGDQRNSNVEAVVSLAKRLAGSGPIFNNLFDRQALEQFASRADRPPVLTGDALAALTGDSISVGLGAASRVVKAGSSASGAAAKYLFENAAGVELGMGIDAVGQRIKAGDTQFLLSNESGYSALDVLRRSIDADLKSDVLDDKLNAQIKGAVLKRLLKAAPQAKTDESSSLTRHLQSEKKQLSADILHEIASGGDAASLLYTMKHLSQPGYGDSARLVRELLPMSQLVKALAELKQQRQGLAAQNESTRYLDFCLENGTSLLQALYGT
jgi:hypothetical protein